MIRTLFQDPKERAKALAAWSIVSGLGAIIGAFTAAGLPGELGAAAATYLLVPKSFDLAAADGQH